MRLDSTNRLSTRNAYSLQKVSATKSSVLDTYLKLEVSQNVKAADKELGSIQSAVLDAMVPLTPIVEADAKGDDVTHKQAVNAAKAAIELVGNFAQKSKELVDQVKAMRSHLPGYKEGKQFFFEMSPQQQGGTSTAKSQDTEKIRAAEDSNVPFKVRDPSGTNECRSTHRSKFFDNRFQKYVNELFSMSGYNSPS